MDERKENKVPVLPWMRSPIDVTHFEDCPLGLVPWLDPRLKKALENMGFSSLFPVQMAVWQETVGPGLFEHDVCVNSPTGSGKTLAYALPIVQALSNRSVKCLKALVVLPTRDLALQVKEVFSSIAPAMGLTVGLAVGQSSIANEISQLIKRPKLEAGICSDPEDFSLGLHGSVDILVATPGRLMDHINSIEGFTLEHLRYLVVDETDILLREAYQCWLPNVLRLTRFDDESFFPRPHTFLPSPFGSLKTIRQSGVERGFRGKPHPRLVKIVLSATLTQDPSKLSQLDLHYPLLLTSGKSRYKLPEKLESYKLIRTMTEKLVSKATQLVENSTTFLRKCLFKVISVGPVPAHIAFIMDGNRRYAKKQNSPVESGHRAGFSSLMTLLVYCHELGVKHVTVYAFSIDNFKRPPEEVKYLMDLMLEKIESMIDQQSTANKYGIRLRFVGNLKLLDERVRAAAERAMRATEGNDKAVLWVCVAYTSRDEIIHAVGEACREKKKVNGSESTIKLVDVEKHMYLSDPDVVIRSSGEMRLSNFLLWQSAYCPLYSPAALWPELGLWHLVWAVLGFQRSYRYLERKKKRI